MEKIIAIATAYNVAIVYCFLKDYFKSKNLIAMSNLHHNYDLIPSVKADFRRKIVGYAIAYIVTLTVAVICWSIAI